jgi:hypothetical protein
MQKSLNQIPSELNNFELPGSASRKKNNFFMQFSKDKQIFEQRLQEDRELLRRKEIQRIQDKMKEETQSQKDQVGAEGLVNQIKKELNSERGLEFQQMLLQVMNGYKQSPEVIFL